VDDRPPRRSRCRTAAVGRGDRRSGIHDGVPDLKRRRWPRAPPSGDGPCSTFDEGRVVKGVNCEKILRDAGAHPRRAAAPLDRAGRRRGSSSSGTSPHTRTSATPTGGSPGAADRRRGVHSHSGRGGAGAPGRQPAGLPGRRRQVGLVTDGVSGRPSCTTSWPPSRFPVRWSYAIDARPAGRGTGFECLHPTGDGAYRVSTLSLGPDRRRFGGRRAAATRRNRRPRGTAGRRPPEITGR